MYAVLVCGGRDYSDRKRLFEVLDAHHAASPIEVLIEGGANGADRLAASWADLNYVAKMTFPADWITHGRAAGPIRNKQMLDEGKPDLVLAFPGGNGTQNMIRQAQKAGVTVAIVDSPAPES